MIKLIKKFKKIAIVILFSLLGTIALSSAIGADAATGEVATYTFKTYKLEDYKVKSNFEDVFGFDYATAVYEIGEYDFWTEASLADAEDYWNGALFNTAIPAGSYATLGFLGHNGDGTITPVKDRRGVYHQGKGKTVEEVRDAIAKYDNLAETTEFVRGDTLVVEAYAQESNTGILSTSVILDFEGMRDENSNPLIPYAPTGFNTNTGSIRGEGKHYAWLGGGDLPATPLKQDQLYIGRVEVHISPTISITNFNITTLSGEKNKSESKNTYFSHSGTVSYNITDSPSNFNIIDKEIKIGGGSSETTLSSIKINDEKADIGTDPVDYVSKPITTNDASIEVAVTDGGKVTGVSSYLTLAAAQAGTGGTPVEAGATGKYDIDMSGIGSGESIYAVISVLSSDTTKTDTHIVQLRKAPSSDATLDGVSFASDSSTSTTVNLLNSSGRPTAFSPTTDSYRISLAKDAANIKFTPIFSKGKTAVINYDGTNEELTSGTEFSFPASTASFSVTVTAQDGSTTKKYTFGVNKLDIDNEAESITVETTGGKKLSATFKDNIYTIENVPFADNEFYITANLKTGQTCTINGSSVTSGTPTLKNFTTPSGYGSIQETFTFVVTSEAGVSKTYTIIVKRAAASSDKSITGIYVNYGISDMTAATTDGNLYTVTNVPFANKSFKVKVILTDGTIQTLTIDSKGCSSGSYSPDISFNTTYTATTKTVTIRVTAQNASFKDYTLEVSRVAAETNSSLTTLSIKTDAGAEVGTWDSSGQTYIIAAGTKLPHSVTSVSVTYTKAGKFSTVKISPSATQNFSSDAEEKITFTITITAEDGTSNSITVNITRAGADNNIDFEISAEYYDTIAGTYVTMPMNTPVPSASIMTTNKNSIPYEASNVRFTITPKSATTTVTVDGSPATDFVKNFTESVGKNTLTVDVLFRTEANPDGMLKQIQFVRDAADGNYDMSFDVKDNSGNIYSPEISVRDSLVYTYTIPAAIAGSNFFIDATTTSAKSNIYYSTNVDNLKANAYDPVTGKEQPFPIGAAGGMYLTCYAQNGNKITYHIITKFTDTRDSNNKISDITIEGTAVPSFTFYQTTKEYTIEVPFTTKQITFNVTLDSGKSTLYQGLSGGAQNLKVGSNTFLFQARAENETLGIEYKIIVNRTAGLTENYIESLLINGINCLTANGTNVLTAFNKYSNSFSFVLPRNTGGTIVQIEVSSGATYEMSVSGSGSSVVTSGSLSVTLTPGKYATVNVSVKSEYATIESGSPNIYEIKIYAAEQDYTINEINLKESKGGALINDISGGSFKFNSGTTTQPTFYVPFSVKNFFFEITANTGNSIVMLNGSTLAKEASPEMYYQSKTLDPGDNEFVIVIKSEYQNLDGTVTTQTKSYTIIINRAAASTDDKLKKLEVLIGGVNKIASFNPMTNTYAIDNVDSSVSTIDIFAEANSPLATVSGDLGAGLALDLSTTGKTSQTYHVYVTSEAEAEKTSPSRNDYKIVVSTTVYVPDGDNSIKTITVTEGGTNYIVYNSGVTEYSVNIPSTVAGVTITATKGNDKASLTIDGAASSTGTQYFSLAAGEIKRVQIQCQAEDGMKGLVYVISITKAKPDNDATLSDLKIDGVTVADFASDTENYTVNVGNTVNQVITSGTPTKTTSKITTNTGTPAVLSVGSNIITIICTAEDGTTTKTYTITVIKDAEDTLKELHVYIDGKDEITFSPTTTTYTVNVPYDQTKVDFQALATGGSFVTLTGTGEKELKVGENSFEIKVQTASGHTKTYTVKITRENGKTDNYIETYETVPGTSLAGLSHSQTSYTYLVDRSVAIFNPTFTVSDGATFAMPDVTAISFGKNEFEIVVTSQTGASRKYKFTVYRADGDSSIEDINILDGAGGNNIKDSIDPTKFIDYNKDTTTYTLNVANSVSQVYLDVILNGYNAVAYVNGSLLTNPYYNLVEGKTTFTIYGVSEYGVYNPADTSAKSASYTIVIEREAADTDSSLKDLTVTIGGKNYIASFDPTTLTYVIENIGDTVTSININGIPNSSKATVSGNTGNITLESFSDGSIAGYVFNFTVTCTAEAGGSYKTDYKITISRGKVDLNKDNSITGLEVKDGLNNEYIGNSDTSSITFNPDITEYEITVPYGADSLTINPQKLAVSPADIYVNGSLISSFYTVFIKKDNLYGKEVIYKFYAVSEDGTKGKEYSLKVNFTAPSDNNDLNELRVDGTMVPGFNASIYNYNLPSVPNTLDEITITAKSVDPYATIQGIGPRDLEVGVNTFVVTVRAQDPTVTPAQYTITIEREAPLPYLIDLSVAGETLLNEKDKETTFDQDTKTYHVIVTYLTVLATISTKVDNSTYTVTCSNSTTISSIDNVFLFNVSLDEGTNPFSINVVSTEGKRVEYKVIIQRRGLASTNTNVASIDIVEIPKFKTDYNNITKDYSYTVPNKIKDLTVYVTPEKVADAKGDGATYQIYNDKNLRVGPNTLIILITAEDGETTRSIVVTVVREEMAFDVDTEATDFECTIVKEKEEYVIDLGNKTAADISDFSKYISYDTEDNLKVEVLSDTTDTKCNEVIVRVTDGSEEKLVTFKLKTTASGGLTVPEFMQNYFPWILLIILGILLVIILICVNRDKYGSINKKRKTQE